MANKYTTKQVLENAIAYREKHIIFLRDEIKVLKRTLRDLTQKELIDERH